MASWPASASRFRHLLAITISVLPLFSGASAARGGVLALDLKGIASGRSAIILAGSAALAAASLTVENADAEERALGRGAIDGPADLGNLYGSGAILAGAATGLAGAGFLEHDPEWRRAGSEMIRSLAYTGVVVTALKVAVRRTRPNGGPYSFPSGHTAAAFAVAPVIASRFGTAAALPAYALAVSTALGRMEDRKHFLSDVVAGAGIGTAIGLAIASERRDREADSDAGPAARATNLSESLPANPKPVFGLGMGPSGLALQARF